MRADETEAPARKLRVAPLRRLVGPPREDRERYRLRTRDDACALAFVVRADVDNQQIGVSAQLVRRIAHDPRAGVGEHVVYPRNCGSTFSPKRRICSWRSAPQSSSITWLQPASRYSSIAS